MRSSLSSQADALGRSTRYLADVRQEQAQALRELARIRLDLIRERSIAGEVDASQQQVQALLAKHDELLRQARDATQAGEDAIDRLEEQRDAQGLTLEAAEAALEDAVAATRKRLENDAVYTKQADGVREAQSIADRAAEKSQLAQQDRAEKGAPYESDPLFMYLWKRKYGTDAYAAFPLFRTLDAWVARLCKYDGARRNYRLLIDIPLRLEEHSQRVAAAAEIAEEELERIEHEAFSADGHDAVEARATQARERLTELDEELASAETRHLELTNEQMQLANGTDPTFRQALEAVLRTLRGKDLLDLRKEVERTPLPEDDILVDKLIELEQEETILEERVRQENESVHGAKRLLGDLEWVRRKFKRARFDATGSRFDSSDFLPGLVSQLSRRSISRDRFWTYLARRHRRPRVHRRRTRHGSFGGLDGIGETMWALASLATDVVGSGSSPSSAPGSFGSSGGGGGGFTTGGGF